MTNYEETCEWCGKATSLLNIDSDGDCLRCEHCYGALYRRCDLCGGEGYGESCELYCDWVNEGDEWVMCPECGGSGWVD